ANALFGFERLDAGTAQGTGVNVNIARAAVRHDKTEAFLVVEELDLALDHRAARPGIACAGKAVAAPKSVPAEPVAAAEPIAAPAEPVATAVASATTTPTALAEITARSARRAHIGCTGIDAVHRDDLQATRRILQIADDRRALRQIR